MSVSTFIAERLVIFIWFLLFVFLISCKSESHTHQHEPNAIELSTPEGFDTFYDSFHTDSTFQLNHILFPLKQKQDLSTWNKDEWIMHKNPLTDTVNVARQIRTISGLVIEVVYHKQGFFLLERRFMPTSNEEWNLIYYSQRTNLQDWERIYEESGIEIKAGADAN